MAETQQIGYAHRELVELMLRDQGIKEGRWAIFIKFGLGAANIGPGPESLQPAAVIPVVEIGLQRTEEDTNLTVDASVLAGGRAARPGGRAARRSRTGA